MKYRFLPLFFGAAAMITFAFWNNEATAQSGPAADGGAELPLNQKCLVTVDAQSNNRSDMSSEMQKLSGFVHPNTVQGTLISVNSDWLVLKDGSNSFWIPRDKVLLLKATP